jgi:rieske iron-sulfur protein
MESSRSGEGTACHSARDLHGSTSQLAGTIGVQARRLFLKSALVVGLGLPVVGEALGDESAAASERPRDGDRFVAAERNGVELKPGDLPLDGPPVLAWPKDPKSGVVRDGSRLNQVPLLRLDPASLDADTRGHAANGSLAYSAICTHAQCPVQGWDKERHVLKCYCHNSEFDPRANGNVVFGPAPRNLPALPARIEGGLLVAVGTFTGRVGSSQV